MNRSVVLEIAKREFKIRLKSRPVMISGVFFIGIAILVPIITNTSGSETKVDQITIYLDSSPEDLNAIKAEFKLIETAKFGYSIRMKDEKFRPSEVKFSEKSSELYAAMKPNEFLVLASDRVSPSALSSIITELRRFRESQFFKIEGLNRNKYDAWSVPEVQVITTNSKIKEDQGLKSASLLIILLYSLISISSGFLAMSIIEEKSSKVIEVLLNTASPREILIGKISGVMCFAFLQFFITVTSYLASAYFSGSSVTLALTPAQGVSFCLSMLVGLVTYAFLYGGLSALVGRSEDMGAVQGPLGLILISSLYGSFYASNSPSDVLTTVSIYVPLICILVIPSLWISNQMSVQNLVLSGTLAVFEMFFIIIFMSKLYEANLIQSGRFSARSLVQYINSKFGGPSIEFQK